MILFRLITLNRMRVLDRMPDNFFAETDQAAFMTQNVPPGVDFSNDPLLQGRRHDHIRQAVTIGRLLSKLPSVSRLRKNDSRV